MKITLEQFKAGVRGIENGNGKTFTDKGLTNLFNSVEQADRELGEESIYDPDFYATEYKEFTLESYLAEYQGVNFETVEDLCDELECDTEIILIDDNSFIMRVNY